MAAASLENNIARDIWLLIKPTGAVAVAIWVSIFVHAIIFSIQFQPELKKFRDSMPTLEVMLVNAKTLEAPKKADVLAQSNLDRGGNTDADKKMKTALPSPSKEVQEVTMEQVAAAQTSAKSAKLKAEQALEKKRVEELEKQAQALMTQIRSLHKIDANATQLAAATDPEQGEQQVKLNKVLDKQALVASSKEMDRLEALIAKQQEEYQKRPRKKFMGARAEEYRFAMYIEYWRQQVERIGNLNYPEAAKNQKMYGQLQMTLEIKSDGSIVSMTINHSSGHQVLDDAAKRIVRLAAPFKPFPDEIKKDTDVLSITRTWTFTQQDALSTE